MKLDRELQRAILERCALAFPNPCDARIMMMDLRVDQATYVPQAIYLEEHGLLRNVASFYVDGTPPAPKHPTITAAGLDFLEDDGGLTAVLGTVVVKLHADTIRELLQARVEQASLPPAEKSALVKQIKGMPAAALNALATRAVQAGVEHVPDLLHWIQGVLP
jgi:hypothetical protein